MANNLLSVVKNSGANKATITISGYLSPWENSSKEVVALINELEAEYGEIEVVLMNCYGGSVFEGIAIYNAMKNSPATINTVAEGLVASMGGILFMGGSTRTMAKMSRLMIHKASTSAEGDAEDLRAQADLVESLEEDLVSIISDCSGKSIADVKQLWMRKGIDTYLNCEEALKLGFSHETVDRKAIVKDAPKNVLKEGDAAIADFYAPQIKNFYNQLNTTEMKLITMFVAAFAVAKVKLDVGAGEEQVLAEVQNLANENVRLTNELAEAKKKADAADTIAAAAKADKVKALIDGAEAAKKFVSAAQKEALEKLANEDYPSAKIVIDTLKPHAPFNTQINNGVPNGTEAERENWNYMKWAKEAPKALAAMQRDEPDRFAKLKADWVASTK